MNVAASIARDALARCRRFRSSSVERRSGRPRYALAMARWSYRDAALLWLFVAAFAIHVAEEWVGGFPDWVANVVSRPMPHAAFLIINGVAMLLMIAGVRAAIRTERSGWIAVTIATIALVNTLAHLAGAVLTRGYAPGLISAVVLYVPLGSLTMIRAIDQRRDQIARGVLAGLLLHAAVFVIAFAVTR
jgi:hypothetical protein